MRLAEPAWLVLLVLVPLPWLGARARGRLRWPSLGGFAAAPRAAAGPVRHLPTLLRTLAVLSMVLALARPQGIGGRTRIAGRGVAIVVAVDRSSSMTQPVGPGPGAGSRLEAARATLARFVAGRPDDLIGLIAFAALPDRIGPPTLDHRFLIEAAGRIRPAGRADDGTNLGDAIAWSLGDLRAASPRKKVLILLTDGRHDPPRAGHEPMEPEAAAALARDLGVTLHTVAVGAPIAVAGLPVPTTGPDLPRLRRLAAIGGGRAFEAADAAALDAVFRALDALETSPVRATIRTRYREHFAPVVALALAALVLDRLLSAGRLRRLP